MSLVDSFQLDIFDRASHAVRFNKRYKPARHLPAIARMYYRSSYLAQAKRAGRHGSADADGRSGHLFQNRYKSVACEEDAYLLELIRYIHLNLLWAGLVKKLEDLDNYPWTGHSAILGRCRNPLIPEQRSHPQRRDKPDKPDRGNKPDNPDQPAKALAEKTVEDVLLHFGNSLKIARRKYREFVEKGIGQGTRPDLQGGGRVRSAGGDASVLYLRDKENHELSDVRILGSGEFACPVKCLCCSISFG